MWLGTKRGVFSDWLTQQWVRASGRRIDLNEHTWLDGPVGNTRQIGIDAFAEYARHHHLDPAHGRTRGLIFSFDQLGLADKRIAPPVRRFYEHTSEYELDVWSEWSGLFRPFGQALARIFSRRLQQLNVPLSSLDSSHGMSSTVLQWRDPRTGIVAQTAWVRQLHATGNILYAGSYSVCPIPGHQLPCVKVVFPLPNGNAVVVMRPQDQGDGSFSVTSAGEKFGDPGFYFVVHGREGTAWARYVRGMKESIHVYPAEGEVVRADHVLWFCGSRFLRLHYRMRPKATPATQKEGQLVRCASIPTF